MILLFIIAVGVCLSETVNAAVYPGSKSISKAGLEEDATVPTARHVKSINRQKISTSFYVDSASLDSENSIESQRKAFQNMLDNRKKERKHHKKHHNSSTKIILRYDYINRKYSITETSDDE